MAIQGCIFCQVAAHEKTAKSFMKTIIASFSMISVLKLRASAGYPRKHITSLNDTLDDDKALLGI